MTGLDPTPRWLSPCHTERYPIDIPSWAVQSDGMTQRCEQSGLIRSTKSPLALTTGQSTPSLATGRACQRIVELSVGADTSQPVGPTPPTTRTTAWRRALITHDDRPRKDKDRATQPSIIKPPKDILGMVKVLAGPRLLRYPNAPYPRAPRPYHAGP